MSLGGPDTGSDYGGPLWDSEKSCPNCGRTEADQPGTPCDVCGALGDGIEPRIRRVDHACSFCGREVPSLRTGYQRVQGWTKPRAAGGANQITGRELLPEYACELCVSRIRDGLSPRQATLT